MYTWNILFLGILRGESWNYFIRAGEEYDISLTDYLQKFNIYFWRIYPSLIDKFHTAMVLGSVGDNLCVCISHLTAHLLPRFYRRRNLAIIILVVARYQQYKAWQTNSQILTDKLCLSTVDRWVQYPIVPISETLITFIENLVIFIIQ